MTQCETTSLKFRLTETHASNVAQRMTLTTQSGRYGYFVQCKNCGGNTPLKRACLLFMIQNTKVSKSQSVFTLGCYACSASIEVFTLSENNADFSAGCF